MYKCIYPYIYIFVCSYIYICMYRYPTASFVGAHGCGSGFRSLVSGHCFGVLLSAVCCLLSGVMLSAVCCLLSAICSIYVRLSESPKSPSTCADFFLILKGYQTFPETILKPDFPNPSTWTTFGSPNGSQIDP